MSDNKNDVGKNDTPESIFRAFKTYMIVNNRISEPHFKSLQYAPFIFFDFVDRVELKYDLSSPESNTEQYIRYKIYFKNNEYVDELWDKRVSALIKTAQGLTWDHVKVYIDHVCVNSENV